jgi:heme/copper-type cytochrome/quinol oxidase subunit 1
MAMSYVIVPVAERRLAAWQPLVFGAGQAVFAVGFAIAGAHGMARKAFGAEQHARTAWQTVGLGVMGVGGLVAAAGGLLFLYLIVKALVRVRQEKAPWLMNGIGSRG